MKTCSEIRLENLERLIDEFGTIEKICENAGVSSGYLSQIRTKAPDSKTKRARVMGDDTARRLEEGNGKERGWMDHDHGEKPPLYATNDPLVARAMRIMEPMPIYAKEQEIRSLAEKKELIELASTNTEQRHTAENK